MQGRVSCFARVCAIGRNHARAKSVKHKKRCGITVRYLGRRFPGPQRNPQILDFIIYADDRRDFSIDPQWAGNKKKKKGA